MAKQQQTDSKADAEETAEEQLTPVGPGALAGTDPEIEEARTKGGEQATAETDDDEEKGDDRRAGHGDDEEDETNLTPEIRAKRERRRAERKQRKEQYRRDQTELRFLRHRNEDLERRFSTIEQRQTGTEQMTLDARIAQVDDQIRLAEQIHGQAVEKGDGNSATEALRIRDDLVNGKRQLSEAKRRAAATVTRREGGGIRPDPEIANRARQWIGDNPWYDPQLRDADSRVAKTIEEGLYQEGRLDPRSDAYWEEYQKRLSKYLPDRVTTSRVDRDEDDDEDEDDEEEEKPEAKVKTEKRSKPGGPTFRTGGRERTLKKGEVYVSAERRKALEEMGAWDDEVLRNRYLRAYDRYDKGAKH